MSKLPAIYLLFGWLLMGCEGNNQLTPQPITELRGVWITNVDSEILNSRESISEALQFLADHHFNVVFPVVWNDAKTLYPSQVMQKEFNLLIDPRYSGRDPLSEIIAEAHRRNIAVIPWFEYGFAASHQKKGGMILEKRPHWIALDNQGQILSKNGFEWLNGYNPEVQDFILQLVLEVVQNYAVDGVQGDDRLPAQPIEGGYSSFTRNLFASETNGSAVPRDFREKQWQRWRADRLNAFAKKLYQQVKLLKPDILVSWAPSVFPWSYDEYLQDWPSWIRGGYADLVIPQVYRYSWPEYAKTLDSQSPDSLKITEYSGMLFPGILINVGEYVISPENLLASIRYNRKSGYQGEVMFFYEGLRKMNNLLADALLATVYQQPAYLPFTIHH